MIENTTGDIFPEVVNVIFRVSEVPKKGFFDSGQAYYAFVFEAKIDGELVLYKERIAIWMCSPLFNALGCEEVKPGHFDVLPAMLLNVRIMASIKHETATKGKSAGKVFARMYDHKPIGREKKPRETEKQAEKYENEVPF